MNKKIIICIVIVILIIIGVLIFTKNNQEDNTYLPKTQKIDTNKKTEDKKTTQDKDEDIYQKMKNEIDKEMKRYLYTIAPNCSSENAGGLLTHKDLVYNNGFDKEKLLDSNNKSYCQAYITYKCVENGKWNWKTTIKCNNYQDKDYKNWADPFPDKKTT